MYILMHRKTRPTGKKIAAALGMKARFKTPVAGDTCAVRWGTAEHANIQSAIQDATAIAKAGNKFVALQCFERDGVPHPTFVTQLPAIRDGVWLGRATHGMCGQDIKIVTPGDIYPAKAQFYTKYIPNTREYRIHVFGDQILGVMGKYLDFPEMAGDGYIKNMSHGYRFRTPSKELKPDRKEAAIAAVKALGLDFGAVDLIVGDDGKTYVLEVNTAPALAPLTFEKYVAAFKQRLAL